MPRHEVRASSALPSDGSEDRRDAEHEHQPGEQLRGPDPAEQVADHGHRDHGDRGTGEALQGAGDGEHAGCSGASAHSTDITACSTRPANSGLRRPTESDSGPMISWPKPSPTNSPVMVAWAWASVAPS